MKNNRFVKRFAAVLLAAATVIGTCIPVAASNASFDSEKKGSISITLKVNEQAVTSGEFTIYQVAKVVQNNADLHFVYTNGFGESNSDNVIDTKANLEDKTLVSKLESKISSNYKGISGTVGSDGKLTFSNLDLGLYLVVQSVASTGYNKANSFLVSVPELVSGTYSYDIDATPKMETLTAPGVTPPGTTPTPGSTTPSSGGSTPTTLPQTGQLDWPIPVLTVAGLFLFAIGWYLRRRKQPDEA